MPHKGTVNNPNGRKKGVPNKLTGDLRAKLQSIIDNNIDRVQDDLDELKPAERLAVLEKLLSYCVPKLQAQTLDIDLQTLSDAQLDQIINSININEHETH